ncbi:MAG: ferrous iron transport protein A [Bdellovibrionales bacterium]|jgi:Fe2+ transport system protein FeoA|nr:ferrous iron transport protein A [Bdellovibrionales bacterium]
MLLSEFALQSRKGSFQNLSEADNKRQQSLALIQSFCGDPLICDRLYELGLRPGIMLEFLGRAPFKGPFLFHYRNTVLALRPAEAACVVVSQQGAT